jgi:hypothetical protein
VIQLPDAPQPDGKRILGAGNGLLLVPSEEEWEAMDKEWRASFRDDQFEVDPA